MSQALPDLVQVAVAGRYSKSPFGLVPFPRRVCRMPPGIDPDYVQSVAYERLVRHNNRKKPLLYPVGRHSLIEVESHFLELSALEPSFECSYGLKLLARQSDSYTFMWKHGPHNMSDRVHQGALAFREVWRIIVSRNSDKCSKCAETVKMRLALSGFVD